MLCSYKEMADKVKKSADNHTARLCETLQPSRLCSEMTEYKPGINGRLTCLRKQTGELLATMHSHMDCLIIYKYL